MAKSMDSMEGVSMFFCLDLWSFVRFFQSLSFFQCYKLQLWQLLLVLAVIADMI